MQPFIRTPYEHDERTARPRRRFMASVLLAGWCILVAGSTAIAETLQTRPKPNVVLIIADDLGYGDLSCYGQKVLATPNIDRLAKEGMRFNQFYAGSTVCAPSRCVLMTGIDTGHCVIRGNGSDNLAPEDRVIPEMMSEQGYRCGLFGKWGLGQEGSTGIPTRKGFHQFFGYLDQVHAHNFFPTFLVRNEGRQKLDNIVPNETSSGAGVASDRKSFAPTLILDEAKKFIRENKSQPFFLVLSINIPHANNEGKEKGMEDRGHGKFADRDWPNAEKGFAEMMRILDEQVGEAITTIDDAGLRDNTLILFTSDNGPHHEGGHDDLFFHSSGSVRGSKRDLLEGGIRVPLLASWPGHVPANTVSEHVAGFQDVFATLGDWFEHSNVPLGHGHGISFLPTLLGRNTDQKQHDHLYWSFYEGGMGQAVRYRDWKGIEQPMGSPLRLYDLSTDLMEERDVADAHPDVVDRVRALMKNSYVPGERWQLQNKN